MKPAFIYVVFNQFFVSDLVCDTKKEALKRVRRMNVMSAGHGTTFRPWRWQRLEGIARTVTLERG